MNRLRVAINNPMLALRWFFRGGKGLTDISLSEISRFMKFRGAVIEAGASDGVDTKRLAEKFTENQIYALEPIKEQFETTQRRVEVYKNVEVWNLALDTSVGSSNMFVGKSGPGISGMGSSSLLEPKYHLKEFPEITFLNKESVSTITLEKFCEEHDVRFIDLLWLDVQGLEMELISHGKRFIQEKVNLIHMEVSRVELYSGSKLYDEIMKEMNQLGFKAKLKRVGRISGNCLFQNTRI